MTEKITINGKVVYKGKIIAINNNSVKIILNNSEIGILYAQEISQNYVNPSIFFRLGDSVFVAIRQRCFDGTLIFTLKGIVNNTVSNFSKHDSIYGIVVATCNKGTIIQITNTITGFISNVYLEKGTAVIASTWKIDNNTNKILLNLDSVLYDDISNVRLNISYNNIEIHHESEIRFVA